MALPAPPSQTGHTTRLRIERTRQMRSLLLLALAVIVFSIWRAGIDRVFTPGWWRLW